MTELSAADLAAIRDRAEAAPSGPWSADGAEIYGVGYDVDGRRVWLAESLDIDDQDRSARIAAFIAAARTDVPALLAHADALEERGSKLTRELDLRSRGQVSENARDLLAQHDWDELIFGGFICLACTPDDADDPDDNVSWPCKPLLDAGITLLHAEALIKLHRAEIELKAARERLAELSRPVSSPPKRPAQYGQMPSLGSVHAACTPDGCQTVADRVQLADDVPTRDAHLAGDHSLCQAQWCADATLPSAEAGIAPEDIDAELNGHEPTPFADGGAR